MNKYHWKTSSLEVTPYGPRQHGLEGLAEFCNGRHFSREKFVLRARAVLYSWIMTNWGLGICLKSLKVWWPYATLFVCLFKFFKYKHWYKEPFITFAVAHLHIFTDADSVGGLPWGAEPRFELKSALQHAMPVHYHLSCAALFLTERGLSMGKTFNFFPFSVDKVCPNKWGCIYTWFGHVLK